MLSVKKEDLRNNYNYAEVEKQRTQESKKWVWLVLLGCFLFQMLPYCVALNLTNVFVGKEWTTWTGGNQTIIGLTFTAGALAAAVAGPFIAKMFGKRINMRLVYILGITLAMIGFAGSSVNSMIAHNNGGAIPNQYGVAAILWISNIISQIGVMIFSGLGVNNLISKWWPPEKRGFALGIAFAGGSLGNIWMQQLVGALSKTFGNSPAGAYDPTGTQFATYLIMAAIGLISGVLVALFVCRKPLAPINILGNQQFNQATAGINVNKPAVLEVSPLSTKKYPPYWILAVGFLILQMGTVHASSNGIFIGKGLLVNNPTFGTYEDILANGGTIFGICCLIGNTGGGILNDKLGPWKSIAIAGTVQCLAILSLMLSPGTPALVYLYFALAGLSVYVYTSTPAFISGRLYGAGQSNNHMSILGIFVAVGFAIVNSISGSLTGDLNVPNTMFGYTTLGNLQNLGLYALVCMGIGTIIVSTCCFIIQNKGIKGLLEYSPTKYTLLIFKHSLTIKFGAKRILWFKKEYRNNITRIERISNKNNKDIYFNAIDDYVKVISVLANGRISNEQVKILADIYYYKYINKNRLMQFNPSLGDVEYWIYPLIEANFIDEFEFKNMNVYYKLSDYFLNCLQEYSEKLDAKYPLIKQSNLKIVQTLDKLDDKLNDKLTKLNDKLTIANNIVIDQQKKQAVVNKNDAKIQKLVAKLDIVNQRNVNKSEWVRYSKEYDILSKIVYCENDKQKYEIKKEAKIAAIQKKIAVSNYVSLFTKNQQLDGHDLVNNYYNNKYQVVDNLMTKKVMDTLERKVDSANIKVINDTKKLEKASLKKEQFEKILA